MQASSCALGVQMSLLVLVAALVAAVSATPAELNNELLDAHMKGIQQQRRTVQLLRDVLREMDEGMATVQKRTCYVNAGLSHGCDYKDVVGAIDEEKYWRSASSPGKRRRRAAEVNQSTLNNGFGDHKSQYIVAQ